MNVKPSPPPANGSRVRRLDRGGRSNAPHTAEPVVPPSRERARAAADDPAEAPIMAAPATASSLSSPPPMPPWAPWAPGGPSGKLEHRSLQLDQLQELLEEQLRELRSPGTTSADVPVEHSGEALPPQAAHELAQLRAERTELLRQRDSLRSQLEWSAAKHAEQQQQLEAERRQLERAREAQAEREMALCRERAELAMERREQAELQWVVRNVWADIHRHRPASTVQTELARAERMLAASYGQQQAALAALQQQMQAAGQALDHAANILEQKRAELQRWFDKLAGSEGAADERRVSS